ncbi:KRFA protein, partial [Fregetta grallaria]|nr:KRFA protein [Fregetta grallaria]
LESSCSEPCVSCCADSRVAIQASLVVVTLPSPILTSFSQSTAMGLSLSAAARRSLSARVFKFFWWLPWSGGG